MSEKIVIDDAMVRRALSGFGATERYPAPHPDVVRQMLFLALNPPAEPEVAVSDQMAAEGWDVWMAFDIINSTRDQRRAMAAIYRAMERARLREAAAAPKGDV